MTTSREQRTTPGRTHDATVARLEQENAQLRSIPTRRLTRPLVSSSRPAGPPAPGFEVLREVSRHTNIKLHTVAETLVGWALWRHCRSRWVRS
ncbi:hypothetical protein ACFU6M_28215 [Streptomyces bottropensis]|uniref:hypothetical protein n=1 Tax=Streptomyces bottropensis TaxID=42235 RepID=UPI0036A2E5B7